MACGETPPPRVLADLDLTNTPSPQPRGLAPPATSVQRFSLRSRRAVLAHPYGGATTEAVHAYPELKPPPRVAGLLMGELVRICPCSWRRALTPGRPRGLCMRDTEEHGEYRLLEAMGRNFREETGAVHLVGSGGPTVAGQACLQELEVHFILQPDGFSDTVVGYAALCRPEGAGGVSPPVLSQIYIEPEYRKLGVATAALGVLLARRRAVLVGEAAIGLAPRAAAGTPAAAGLLARLGFRQTRGQERIHASGAAEGYLLFRRPASACGGDDGENLR